jgi:hypothetical protein
MTPFFVVFIENGPAVAGSMIGPSSDTLTDESFVLLLPPAPRLRFPVLPGQRRQILQRQLALLECRSLAVVK